MPVKFTFASPLMRSWLLIHQSHRLLEKNENAILSKFGLTVRKHAVLMAMKHLQEPIIVSDVATWLDRNPNGISMLVDRMVKDELIQRIRDLPDRRAARLEMTQKGDRLYEESVKHIRKLYDDIFSVLSEEELETLSTLLGQIRRRSLTLLEPDRPEEELEILDE